MKEIGSYPSTMSPSRSNRQRSRLLPPGALPFTLLQTVGYAAPRLLSPSLGGMNMTVIVLDPHRGQRRRLATSDSGKSRPRVATSVSMSRS
ncbi:hypothetical protein ABIA25_001773 [Sinorhizobium fredii]